MFFKRVIIALFGFFITLMLFIFIIRIANHKSGFLGISDLFDYFDSGKVDFYKPFKTMIDNIVNVFNGFSQIVEKAKNINNAWDVLSILGAGLVQGLKLISFPVILIFEIIRMIVGYIMIFIDFINWIISFNGWMPPAS